MHPLRLAIGRGSCVLTEGQINPGDLPCPGIWIDDARFLSRFQLFVDGSRVAASGMTNDEGFAAEVDYAMTIPTLSMRGQWVLHANGTLFCGLVLQNNGTQDVTMGLDILVAADFLDLFQARGYVPEVIGAPDSIVISNNTLTMGFSWNDAVRKKTRIAFSGSSPTSIDTDGAHYSLVLAANAVTNIEVAIEADAGTEAGSCSRSASLKSSREIARLWKQEGASITASSPEFNRALARAELDLFMLNLPTAVGNITTAGIPYFRVPFGRDGAISGLQTGPFRPNAARATVEYLGRWLGVRADEYTREEPGKIIHELRLGPLARMGLIPHKPYYGSIDATPLWLMLLFQHLDWSGDIAWGRSLRPAVESAINYLLRSLVEGRGYMRYQRRHDQDLANQSWKDSNDSMRFADGSLSTPPLGCCEVQAYCYAALHGAGLRGEALGLSNSVQEIARAAALDLRARFNQDFWMPGAGFLALALDGSGRQVDSISSNPGHVLSTGIMDDERARLVAQRLMADDMFSGWGIRTMSSDMGGYSPTSYHCGTVWPHDTAMAAAGFCRVGEFASAHRLMAALLDATCARDDGRLPELFSGVPRQEGEALQRSEEEACYPQAWSAGALIQILSACLGFEADALGGSFRLNPHTPDWLGEITIRRLRFAGGELDFQVTPHGGGLASCSILRNTTGLTPSIG